MVYGRWRLAKRQRLWWPWLCSLGQSFCVSVCPIQSGNFLATLPAGRRYCGRQIMSPTFLWKVVASWYVS
uniref:Putative secreted protein n=1 Tax=Anopheles marajoara TaxID=58244 RepID=A0A2M4CEZ3_9DIPT